MVIHYNIDNICDIIKSEEFISNYNKLSESDEKIKEIKLFLETIQKNKNYYRLNINPLVNLNSSVDITIIKSITNNINKITDVNKDIIYKEILDILDNKNLETINIVVNILIDSIIINSSFSELYIGLLKQIILKYKIDLNILIDKFHNLLYKNYKDTEIKDYYNLLCEKNKCTDNSIGYSSLVVRLENNNLIENKIDKLVDELITKFDINNQEDLYKYILCIFNIVKLKDIKKEDKIYQQIKEKIDYVSQNIENKKIKFKIMDINDILDP
tara:strand:+ start:937 stop:1749 length:813 start_codon:yes stop_codon:yes gene_type:complete